MSKKLPVVAFEWVKDMSKFSEDFIKSYIEDSDTGNYNDLPFFTRKMFEKLACSFNDKKDYLVHMITSKQVLNHELVLQEVCRVIKFIQKTWLKPRTDMITELRIM